MKVTGDHMEISIGGTTVIRDGKSTYVEEPNTDPIVKEIKGLMSRQARKQLAKKTHTKFVGISQYRGAADKEWKWLR